MKKIVLLFVLLSGGVFAANNPNALGVFLWSGGGAGLDYKRLMGSSNTLDIYLGSPNLCFGCKDKETKLDLDAGYYFLFNVIKADPSVGSFPLYAGPNVSFHYWSRGKHDNFGGYDGFDIGAGVAGGISWFTPTTPKMDVSLELVSGPAIRLWNHKQAPLDREWELRLLDVGNFGLRLLFHVYFF
jgi:hypothetical protein